MTIKATYYGANGWLIELDKTRILIDPWLNGDLTFPPGDWLIKGVLGKEVEIPRSIDFLLLTQGQPDHAHPPTLEKINKSIPVIASQAASNVVSKIGFTEINTLKPGEAFKKNNIKHNQDSRLFLVSKIVNRLIEKILFKKDMIPNFKNGHRVQQLIESTLKSSQSNGKWINLK